jgi:hypothetical protein
MASLYPNPVKLRWRLWSREVFGADYRAKCFWGAFVIALIGYAAQSLTNVPRYVGLSIKWPAITVAAVAFVWSNVAAFSRAVEHAELKEGELAGLILKIAKRKVTAHVSPGDVFYGGEGYRSVVVQLELVVKNKDGMNEASIELESCRTNVSQDEPDELKFMKQIYPNNQIDDDEKRRHVPAGGTPTFYVVAVYRFPTAHPEIDPDGVKGEPSHRSRPCAEFPKHFSTCVVSQSPSARLIRPTGL